MFEFLTLVYCASVFLAGIYVSFNIEQLSNNLDIKRKAKGKKQLKPWQTKFSCYFGGVFIPVFNTIIGVFGVIGMIILSGKKT